MSPQEMFPNVSPDKVEQLIRRLTVIAHMETLGRLGYGIHREKGSQEQMIEPLFLEDDDITLSFIY
jgi:hypothetical protein